MPKNDSSELILSLVVLAVILVYLFVRRGRKKKDIYGFHLPDWKVLTDDQRLYEIEQAFRYGTISQCLNQTGFTISDWHSNFEHKNRAACATGYIELSKYGVGYNSKLESSVVVTTLKTAGYRYFWCQLNNSYDRVMQIDSKSYAALENNPVVQKIVDSLNELEAVKGPHSWHVIFYKNELAILIDELWTQSDLDQFLRIALDISRKI